MNSLQATTRNTTTKGQVDQLRKNGEVPAIVYGGKEKIKKFHCQKKKSNF